MPSHTTALLPMPKSWDEFEDITADILKSIWKDEYIIRNGRTGQRQNGVDIYGKPHYLNGEYSGCQCKNTVTTIGEIKQEIKEAEKFKPELKEFVFFVGSKRDSKLQEEVRLLDLERLKSNKFGIKILFWEDMCLRLSNYPDLMEKHFPQFVEKKPSTYDNIRKQIMESDPSDWLFDDEHGIYTFKKDTNLTLRRDRFENSRDFHEEWMNVYANNEGNTSYHDIYYGSSFIERIYIVGVDGYRMYIPFPKMPELTITKFQYIIGCIINRSGMHHGYDFDEYLHRAKIKIVEE